MGQCTDFRSLVLLLIDFEKSFDNVNEGAIEKLLEQLKSVGKATYNALHRDRISKKFKVATRVANSSIFLSTLFLPVIGDISHANQASMDELSFNKPLDYVHGICLLSDRIME